MYYNIQDHGVKGQGHSVDVSAATERCQSGTDRLTEFKLGENYPRAERNT